MNYKYTRRQNLIAFNIMPVAYERLSIFFQKMQCPVNCSIRVEFNEKLIDANNDYKKYRETLAQ